MATLGERIQAARKHAGFSQAELGRRVSGVSREAVSQWESSTSAPTADKLTLIAKETGVSGEWLISERGEMLPAKGPPDGAISELLRPNHAWPTTSETIPVMGVAEGGPDGLFEWNGDPVDRVPQPHYLAGAKGAYAVFCSGDSMIPRFRPGETLYVNPARPVTTGAFVVVQFRRDGHTSGETPVAWVKEFVRRDARQVVLRQFNPAQDLKIPAGKIIAIHRIVGSSET